MRDGIHGIGECFLPEVSPQPCHPVPPAPAVSTSLVPSSRHTPVAEGYDACDAGRCDNPQSRPHLEFGASIHIVFGIKDIDRSGLTPGSVLSEKVSVLWYTVLRVGLDCYWGVWDRL